MSRAPLDDDALDLLDAFRQREQIPAEVHDRVWERVSADVDRGGVPPSRWARRGAVIGLLAVAAATVLWLGGRVLTTPQTARSDHQAGYDRATGAPSGEATARRPSRSSGAPTSKARPTTEVEPEPAAAIEPLPAVAEEPASTAPAPAPAASVPSKPKRRSTSRTPAPSPEPEPPAADTLAEENRLLGRARAALIAEQPERALTLLGEHARRFEQGVLAQERQALRAVALCEAGRHDQGTAAARSFLKAHPHAALARRVRSACLE